MSDQQQDNPLGPPPWLNAPPVDPYPYEETHDLRKGADLHPALLGLLPFVGLWRGRGQGGFPAEKDYDFAQEVRISHDGRPFLRYESRSWLLDDESKPAGEWIVESGFWRPVPDAEGRATDEMEAVIVAPEGTVEIYVGNTIGTTRLEIDTDAVAYTPTGQHLTGARRLFGIVEGALLYAHEVSIDKSELQPHMSARLLRVGG
ncbi:MAG: FABP family protein [Actinomycetota bacterium]|nr:FABP family protein [Actinomycetota bacterium]